VRLGAVPEIVEEGVTGCMANGMDDFSNIVLRSIELDRRQVRRHAEQRFSAGQMARAYGRLYEQILSGSP
jgi:hypothetical protein